MTVYDWSRVSRETLEAMADAVCDKHVSMGSAHERIEKAKAEALVPPLRTRAEVDREIAELIRDYIRDQGPESAFGTMSRDRGRLLRLVAEPLDLPPVIDCEFPEAAPDECERGGDCIESITHPGFCARREREMPRRVPGETDPEPCSCEESERLKARVRELEADRDHFKGIWQVECDRTVRALKHQETAEGQARALRERLEALCKGSGIPGAEPGIVLTRQVLEVIRA
jgi:hypothetical protein